MTIDIQERLPIRILKFIFVAVQVVIGPFVYYTVFFTLPLAAGFTGVTIPKIDLWNDFTLVNLSQVLSFVGYSLLFTSRGLIAATPILLPIWIFTVRAATYKHSGWVVLMIANWLIWLELGVAIWACLLIRKFSGATWMISGM